MLFGQDSFVNLRLNKLLVEHIRASKVFPALSEPLLKEASKNGQDGEEVDHDYFLSPDLPSSDAFRIRVGAYSKNGVVVSVGHA